MAYEDIHRPLGAAGFRGAVKWIILISGIVFLLQQFYPALQYIFGLRPYAVIHDHWVWQLVSYTFLHGGVFHWLFNMLVIWMFGRELEIRWGRWPFLLFFFICSLGAALTLLVLNPTSTVATIGASGAAMGITVAFAMMFPEAVLYLYFVIPVKAWQAAILFAIIALVTGVQSAPGQGMASYAHLGGMATGFLYMLARGYGRYDWTPPFRAVLAHLVKKVKPRAPGQIPLEEVTDDLVKEVDRILDKVLKEGPTSLTPRERKIMEKYSKRRL